MHFAPIRTRPWIAFVVAISLGIRLFALWLAVGVDHGSDSANYLWLGRSIASGHGLTLPIAGQAYLPTAQFPPLYPLILGTVAYVVPLTAATLTVVNTAIDAVTAWLIFRLGREAGRPDAGAAAALAYLCWPSIALMAPLAYKEGLVIAIVLGLILAYIRLANAPNRRSAAVVGLLVAALALAQPALAPFAAMLFLLFLFRSPDRRRYLAMFPLIAAVAMVALLPWWLRNYDQFGHFIPFTSSGGLALWVGAQPTGGMKWLPAPDACVRLADAAADLCNRQHAMAIIFADPAGYIARALMKLPKSFLMTNWAADQLVLAHGEPKLSLAATSWLRVLPALLDLALVALALFGAALRPRLLIAQLLWLGIAQILLFGIWFEFSERHRLFLLPIMLLLAAMVVRRERFLQPNS